jgi:hypothetical protein
MDTKENDPHVDQPSGDEPESDRLDDEEPASALEFFERPPLLIGECPEAYALLKEEVLDLLKPANLFEKLEALDIVNSIWESNRMRKLSAGIVNNARVSALTLLLAPFFNEDYDAAIQCAQECYAGDKEAKKKALRQVRHFKITNAQISAQAYLINTLPITVLDRGIRNREDLRRSLVKQHNKAARKAEKAKRRQENATLKASGLHATTQEPGSSNDNSTPTQNPLPPRNLKRRGGI